MPFQIALRDDQKKVLFLLSPPSFLCVFISIMKYIMMIITGSPNTSEKRNEFLHLD